MQANTLCRELQTPTTHLKPRLRTPTLVLPMRFQADPDRLLIQPLDCTDHRMETPNWSKGSALDNEVEVDTPSQRLC